MQEFEPFFEKIEDPEHLATFKSVLAWVEKTFPQLERRYGWNQPMYTDHGTFIVGFNIAKPHFSVAPEGQTVEHFSEEIKAAGYEHGKMFIKIKWDGLIDFNLLERIIQFNIIDKKQCDTFWRK